MSVRIQFTIGLILFGAFAVHPALTEAQVQRNSQPMVFSLSEGQQTEGGQSEGRQSESRQSESRQVEYVSYGVRHPAELKASRSSAIDGHTVLIIGAHVDPVPVGKRLIVENVSFDLSSADMHGEPVCNVVVRIPNQVDELAKHHVPTESAYTGVRHRAFASQQVELYADTGQEVGVVCSVRVLQDTNLDIAVSGYYVDVIVSAPAVRVD